MWALPNLGAAVRRTPSVSLLLAVLAVCVQFSPQAMDWLQYERGAIADGQLWRIVTGHLTHCSFDHLFWDVAALVVLGWLCEADDRRRWCRCVTLSAVCIPLGLWVLRPDVQTYRGLSGIDSALFVLLAVSILRESRSSQRTFSAAAAAAFLCGFAAKTGYEFLTVQTMFVDSTAAGMVPIPLAHVIGGIIGAATALDSRVIRIRRG